jgi:hypothetical protein
VESVDALERVGANVMGTLLVGTPNAGRRQAYYYDYYSVEGKMRWARRNRRSDG